MILRLKTIKLLKHQLFFLACLGVMVLLPGSVSAIGGPSYISETGGQHLFPLSASGTSTTLCISSDDYPGVIRALKDLKLDIGKVTDREPSLAFDKLPHQKELVVAGTIGKNPFIDKLVKNGKLDISAISGKWEAFTIQTVYKPFPGVDKALVIVGSDKRGTIYGIYDVSEQIGVSPWYFWADVPIGHKNALFVKPGIYTQHPSVMYRGIFLNDEAPALTNWVKGKYGLAKSSLNPPVGKEVVNYGHEFYSRIFELMLRMKANYLWPAMWSNAFNEDDAENPRLADEYGIVMGTSHQEPMLRSQQEWDRRYYGTIGHWNYTKHPDVMQDFWREGVRRNKNYESIITMGLRGANDSEMSGDLKSNIAMVENVVNQQQKILREELNPDLNKVPQSWCLYKEIMDYYNEGMRVPDDITLLWSDDNWGNIRRLSTPEERKRSGGSGVYYHFDYHGGPRSYEWINTNPIAKIWDQMALAKQYGADRIWIVNVGHFKGYELPMEYFLSLAWNTDQWTNSNINEYTRLWVTREFGAAYAGEITDILSTYTKFNGRRKPESLSPGTYSLVNYQEAENVVAEFNQIKAQAEAIYSKLPQEMRNAFYEIVLFPVKASATVNELYLAAAKNNLYASQRRASTNDMDLKARAFFQADTDLMAYYNREFAGGKWNHFMDETHIGYTSWMPPKKNNLDAIHLTKIQVPDSAILGVAVEGSESSWPGSSEIAILPVFDIFNGRQHAFEIFNRGSIPVEYTITTNVLWLSFNNGKGTVKNEDKRILVNLVDSGLPEGKSEGQIKIVGAGREVTIAVNAFNPPPVNHKTLDGFVESGGVVSIEAEHYAQNIGQGDRKWLEVEDYGLTLSGMRATAPANAPAAVPGKDAPCLAYHMYLFTADSARIILVTSPLLNFMPGRDIRLAVSVDDGLPEYITNVPVKLSNKAWEHDVVNQARYCRATLKIDRPGYHTLKVWMIDPGVVVEKIMVDMGGLKSSYLGAPESYRHLK